MHNEDVMLIAGSREQPQWAFGYGAAWGNSGWGLYEYSGWGISATTYSDADDSHSQTQQINTTDSETNQQVA